MKHKRQSLGKQGDDGDDKDSVTSDGGKSSKLSDKFHDDELSKKSCQGCEMPTAGLCGSHEDVPDIGSTRGNNNNTPSATNNNTNFNNNSNGASSVASSGSFDKMMTEEDSRSNEDSGAHASPRQSKKSTAGGSGIKIEGRKSSPNVADRKISLSKMSPGISKDPPVHSTSEIPLKSGGKNITPPAVLTPTMHNSPLGKITINSFLTMKNTPD